MIVDAASRDLTKLVAQNLGKIHGAAARGLEVGSANAPGKFVETWLSRPSTLRPYRAVESEGNCFGANPIIGWKGHEAEYGSKTHWDKAMAWLQDSFKAIRTSAKPGRQDEATRRIYTLAGEGRREIKAVKPDLVAIADDSWVGLQDRRGIPTKEHWEGLARWSKANKNLEATYKDAFAKLQEIEQLSDRPWWRFDKLRTLLGFSPA